MLKEWGGDLVGFSAEQHRDVHNARIIPRPSAGGHGVFTPLSKGGGRDSAKRALGPERWN